MSGPRFPIHGLVGAAVIVGAELLLVSGSELVGRWFTPIVWTGYVFMMDAVVRSLTGRSYLTTDRVEGVLVALASVAGWWLFELYNAPRFWRGGEDALGLWWRYHGLEPNPFLRRVGYDWSFATIFPALFLTAVVLKTTVFRRARVRAWRPSPSVLRFAVATGALSVLVSLVVVYSCVVSMVCASLV